MTSLQETLPALDQAVPALPGKLEGVLREADSFERSARAALAVFQTKQAAAAGLLEQVRQAADLFHGQAVEGRGSIDEGGQALRDASQQEARGIDDGSDALLPVGDEARSAFEALRACLDQADGRTRMAHEQAVSAVNALDDAAQACESDLRDAADVVTASIGEAQDAIVEGQAAVAKGVSTLSGTLARLLESMQGRLERTIARLEELRDEQEGEIADTQAALVEGRQQVEQNVRAGMDEAVRAGLDPVLEALAAAWSALGTQAVRVEDDCRTRREELEPRLAGLGARVEPLQVAVVQVKQAADQVQLPWP